MERSSVNFVDQYVCSDAINDSRVVEGRMKQAGRVQLGVQDVASAQAD